MTKKILFFIISLSAIFYSIKNFALGDLAHNYVAKKAATEAQTKDARLQSILTVYQNTYLVGSDYPDTGYVPGFHYGEASHWPYFVDPFIDYIKKNYSAPKTMAEQEHRDQLIAFLLGVCTHVQSDIVSHQVYYNFVAQHDFGSTDHDAWEKAHDAMDPASDYDVIVKQGIHDHPVIWWVPVTDLVNVYKIMKEKNIIQETVTAQQIIEANAIYYVATGLPENVVAYPMYEYDSQYYIPWGMAHLEDPNPQYGAFPEMAHQSAQYVENAWQRIQNQSVQYVSLAHARGSCCANSDTHSLLLINKIKKQIASGILQIKPTYDAFGDVIFTPNSIQFRSKITK